MTHAVIPGFGPEGYVRLRITDRYAPIPTTFWGSRRARVWSKLYTASWRAICRQRANRPAGWGLVSRPCLRSLPRIVQGTPGYRG
jgi:hypothetical protein